MPIDFTEYVDLSVHDLSPTDIYLGAIELARLVLPEFELRQGTPDDALFQAMAQMSALQVVAINRLPNRLMQGIGAIMGVQRDEGRRATVTATIVADYDGAFIPANTNVIQNATILGEQEQYYYSTATDVTIPAVTVTENPDGSPAAFPTADVQLVALYTGIQPTVNANTDFVLDVVNPSILNIFSLDDFVNGSNAEEATAYMDRLATSLRGASNTVTTANQMQAYLLANRTDLSKVKVYDNTDPEDAYSAQIGSAPSRGYTAIYAYGINRTLTEEELYDVTVDISEVSTAGLNISTQNFTFIDLGVTVSFVVDRAYDLGDMQQLVVDRIADLLSPTGFTSEAEAVQTSEIANIVRSLTGVRYVESVALSDPDNLLASGDPLIQVDSFGNYNFTKKGILPFIDAVNITATGRVQ